MPIILEPTDLSIQRAAEAMRAGRAVAFPTETVYGLGALTHDPRGIAEVYRMKWRPSNNPLIAHVLDAHGAREIVEGWDPRCDELTSRLWPGPLTLVLPRRANVPVEAAGGRTVGVSRLRSAARAPASASGLHGRGVAAAPRCRPPPAWLHQRGASRLVLADEAAGDVPDG